MSDHSDPLEKSAVMRRECGGISAVTEWRWNKQGIITPDQIINGRKYYRRSTIDQFKASAKGGD